MMTRITKVVAILAGILIILNTGFYLFILGPKMKLLKDMKTGPKGIVKLSATLEEDKAFIKNLKKYEKEYEEAEAYLEKLKKSGPEDGTAGEDSSPENDNYL